MNVGWIPSKKKRKKVCAQVCVVHESMCLENDI
jgi:hypothetical protein